MKKIVLGVIIIFNLHVSVFSAAPELQNVLPTEWKNMNILSKETNREFLNQYQTELLIMEDKYHIPLTTKGLVYVQAVGIDVFYWILTKNQDRADCYEYILTRKAEKGIQVLSLAVYNIIARDMVSGESSIVCQTITITKSKNGARGFLETTGMIGCNENGTELLDKVKKQYKGSCYGTYYLLSEISETDIFHRKDWESKGIKIKASDFLWDEKTPLKYGLQNAFDGNPATSYVENTEDDLMEIEIQSVKVFTKDTFCNTLYIINGYGSNESLYSKNNRIKDVIFYSCLWQQQNTSDNPWLNDELVFNDGYLEKQMKTISVKKGCYNYSFTVVGTYNGSLFNDTCLAELNLKFNTLGWLFGDKDE